MKFGNLSILILVCVSILAVLYIERVFDFINLYHDASSMSRALCGSPGFIRLYSNNQLESTKVCKNPIQKRAYAMKPFFPFSSFLMVLETRQGACDLVPVRCQIFTAGLYHYPEYFVREAIASFVLSCGDPVNGGQRQCIAYDLGSNIGYYTGYMASLGAKVVSVEPQIHLVQALNDTVSANCWDDQVTVIHGALSVNAEDDGKLLTLKQGWSMTTPKGAGDVMKVPAVVIQKLFHDVDADFVKLDIDSIEPQVLLTLARMITAGNTKVQTIVVELSASNSDISGKALSQFQNTLGYDIYRLNHNLDSRFFDGKGHDIYSGYKSIGLDSNVYEERYHQRFMRYLQFVKPGRKHTEWKSILKGREFPDGFKAAGSLLITKVQLLEPVVEHTTAIHKPSKFRMKSKYPFNEKGIY